MAKSKIFISYSKEDQPKVNLLVRALDDQKIEYWSEEKIMPGTEWGKEIESAINSASTYIFFISPDFLNSNWAMVEMGMALNQVKNSNAKIIPVVLESGPLPNYIKRLNYIDARNLTPLEFARRVQNIINSEDDSLIRADKYQLQLIKQGVQPWNKWRSEHQEIKINLSGANLSGLNLSGIDLSEAVADSIDLSNTDLSKANLNKAHLLKANLYKANLSGANFKYALLDKAYLAFTNLNRAFLYGTSLFQANLSSADLTEADLFGANLTEANLQNASLINSNIEQAKLTNSKIDGLSTSGISGMPKDQSNLIITPSAEVEIIVDDLQVAQFIYLLLNNENVRNVIDTITSKAVLILGRFTGERKAVLDAIRGEVRGLNFTPIFFDFDKAKSKDLTETVETLARMARFIIADLTDPSSIPHELANIVPHLRTTPIQLIKLEGASGYSMIEDYIGAYKWLLEPYEYKDTNSLVASLPKMIASANKKAKGFRKKNV